MASLVLISAATVLANKALDKALDKVLDSFLSMVTGGNISVVDKKIIERMRTKLLSNKNYYKELTEKCPSYKDELKKIIQDLKHILPPLNLCRLMSSQLQSLVSVIL